MRTVSFHADDLAKALPRRKIATIDWPLSLPAAVGLLHLLTAKAPVTPSPKWLKALIYGPLPVFVLLCAKETFGNPPLMAAAERPIAQLAGTWSAPDDAITISPDSNVSRTVGEATIQSACLTPNRSWFGRLLHRSTDYRIRDALTARQPISMLLNSESARLTGTLEWPGRPSHARVRLERR